MGTVVVRGGGGGERGEWGERWERGGTGGGGEGRGGGERDGNRGGTGGGGGEGGNGEKEMGTVVVRGGGGGGGGMGRDGNRGGRESVGCYNRFHVTNPNPRHCNLSLHHADVILVTATPQVRGPLTFGSACHRWQQ